MLTILTHLLAMIAAFVAAGILLAPDEPPPRARPTPVKVVEAPPPAPRESWQLTLPLSCHGPWATSCADFGPCRVWCDGTEVRR